MRNEQWLFYENFSVFGQIENLWMDKITSKTFISIQGNWAGKNSITASRVNYALRDESEIYNYFRIINLLMESCGGYAWPGLTVNCLKYLTA